MTNQNALLGLCNYVFEKQHYSYCQCVHQIACAIVLEKGTAYYFKNRMPIWQDVEMLTKRETKILTGNYASNMGIRDFVQKMGC